MENDYYGMFDESFDSVIQELTNFVGCAAELPKNADEIFKYCNYRNFDIKSRIYKYLSNPKNIQRLKNYVDILKKIPYKKIEESFPDSTYNVFGDNDTTIYSREEERDKLKLQIQDAIEFISEILNTRKKIAPKPKYYFEYKDKEHIKLSKFKEALIKYELIDDTPHFTEIMKERNENGNYINWKTHTTYLRYFIEELFKTGLLKGKKKWKITESSFTVNGLPIPDYLRTYVDDLKDATIKKNIDDAISILTKQNPLQ